MFDTVELPAWLLILILGFAMVSFATHFLFPSVRWFFRRRAERALSQLNARLDRKIDLFKLARRSDMVARLAYDRQVVEAAMAHAAETGVPGEVAFEKARRYAREIVPAFSATVYFGFGTGAAKWLSRLLFEVRVGRVDAELAELDPKATVIFVMNHRSNLDYVLVTWLVAERSAISYAVGEWARVWPLSALIRSMGAYFIRRGSHNALYRKVLARYVQMARDEGMTQAIFPEGGLSLNGQVGTARMGLLSYIVEDFDPAGRDVVFVPVGLAYDRVLEDRVLVEAAASGTRRFRNRPAWVAMYAVRFLWARVRGRTKGFGTAAAGFGPPLSLRAHLAAGGTVEQLGARLMGAISAVVPVLPVPLVARALGEGVASREELVDRVTALVAQLRAAGAVLRLPSEAATLLDEGLDPLIRRGLVGEDLQPVARHRALLAFYAASVPEIQVPPQRGRHKITNSAFILLQSCAAKDYLRRRGAAILRRGNHLEALLALDTQTAPAIYDAPKKDLYELGEMPPLGHVPKQMYAWAIRRDRHGPPEQAMVQEVVDTWTIDSHEVLVLVMAAGVNYNGVWAGLGQPISPFDGHKADYHIAGSDAAGIVWAVGDKVKRWKVGDEVVIHCNQDDGDDEECNGGDPMFSPTQRIWGYETPDGSFAQFTRVQAQQLMPRPKHLTWEESACYTLTLATAYRMLFGHEPHDLKPGQNVLVWGASGGLGSYAIQLINTAGANAIGVISDESKRDFVMGLGAKGVINRNDFKCWGQLPKVNTPEYNDWLKEARRFGKAIWDITGKGVNVDMVFEHPGEATFPVSSLVCKKGGMVVICAGTTGFNCTFDVRYMWMHQKRLQGSHFAHLKQAASANKLMVERRLDPCMSEVFPWADIPKAHTLMWKNQHKPGNMAVLVQAPRTGLRTFEDTLEASLGR